MRFAPKAIAWSRKALNLISALHSTSGLGVRPAEYSARKAAKTRYRQADAACRIDRIGDEDLEVEFSAPQWAVTPGQSVVLYREDVCLGGGVIQ